MVCCLPMVTMSVNTFVAKEPAKKLTAQSIAPPISTARQPYFFMKNDTIGPGSFEVFVWAQIKGEEIDRKKNIFACIPRSDANPDTKLKIDDV